MRLGKKMGSREDYECFLAEQAKLYARHVQEAHGLPDPETARSPQFVPVYKPAKFVTESCEDTTHETETMLFKRENFMMFGACILAWVYYE